MAKASAAYRPNTKLKFLPSGEMSKISILSTGTKGKPPGLMRKHYGFGTVQSLTWHSVPPSNQHRISADHSSDIQFGSCCSRILSVLDYSGYPRERGQLLQCRAPGKTTVGVPVSTGLPANLRKFGWLVTAATLALLTSSLLVRSTQNPFSLEEAELFSSARPPLWVVASVAIWRSTLLRSALNAALPLVLLAQPESATATETGSSSRTSVLQREHIYVSNGEGVRVAVDASSLPSATLPEESAPRDHSTNNKSRGVPEKAGAAEGDRREGTSVEGQRTEKVVGPPLEQREDQPGDRVSFYYHRVDDASNDASAVSGASLQHLARLHKLLLTLDNCHTDDDCFGSGRRCIEGRCWGFAGPVLRPFICRPGDVCTLDKLKGHFYGENGGKEQGSFMLKVYRGNDFNVCGGRVVSWEAPTTFTDDLRTVTSSRLHAPKKSSSSASDAAELRVTPLSVGEPGAAEAAGVRTDPQELLEDQPLTDVHDGRCLSREKTSDCAFTFGSQPLFMKSEQLRTDSREDQRVVPVATGKPAPSENQYISFGGRSTGQRVIRERLLQVNHPYYCNFPSELRPQAVCDANLGEVPADMPAGMYIVCGCSGTDLNQIGTQCASEEDFAVPVARLLVAGFSQDFLRTSLDTQRNSADSSRRSGTQNDAESIADRRKLRLPLDTHEQEVVEDQSRSKRGTVRDGGTEVLFVSETSQKASSEGNRETRRPMPSAIGNNTTYGSLATSGSHADAAAAEVGGAQPSPLIELAPQTRPVYQCSTGQLCSILGIRGVALNSGDFFVDFLRGQRQSCSAEQTPENAKPILRLPCQSYAAGSLCMVSLSPAHVADFLSNELFQKKSATTVNFSLVGNDQGLSHHNGAETSSRGVEIPAEGRLELGAFSTSSTSTSGSSPSPSASIEAPQRHVHRPTSLSEALSKFGSYRAPTQFWSKSSGRFPPGGKVTERGSSRWLAAAVTPSRQETHVGSSLEGVERDSYNAPTAATLLLNAAAATKPVATTAIAHSTTTKRFVATLCGCSSSETANFGHRCRASLFLGHLVVHGPVSGSEHTAKTTVLPRDQTADPSASGKNAEGDKGAAIQKKGEGEEEEGQNDVDAGIDEEIVLRSSPPSPFSLEGTLVGEQASTFESSLLSSSTAARRPMQSRSSPWRLLQYITGPAANTPSNPGDNGSYSRTANECRVNTDCLSGTGVCDRGKCTGFIPDKDDSRLFRCVEGYWCDLKEGQIEGINITSKFEVIATSPSEPCGTARNLRPNESLFANANKWLCDSSSSTSCIFRAGVGHRRNRSHTVEGVRLCGCPHIDINGDGIPCNHVRDFFVPLDIQVNLGAYTMDIYVDLRLPCSLILDDLHLSVHGDGVHTRQQPAVMLAPRAPRSQSILSRQSPESPSLGPLAEGFRREEGLLGCRLAVQECLTNAHCIDNAFAYCIEDHCGGFLVSAAAAGVNAFTCIRNQQCTLQSIAAKSVDQALKVIPVAANFSCGAEAALDPEYVKTSALPCIADVNNDGVCDINLGVNRALGTTRLCGCSGQDLGGNGRACDEAKDFDRDLGLVSNVQCIINQDCPPSAICAKGECVEDDLEPYIVSMLPQNNTFAVPPLSHIDLLFNENIKFGRPGAAILIANLQQPSHKYLITLPPNAPTLKRIAAPLLGPGGVLPRFGGGGGAAGGGGITAAAAEGGGGATATAGLFGRGQSHTGILANKLADRENLPSQQNGQHRPSRKLGASRGPEGARASANADLTNKQEGEIERLDDLEAAAGRPAKLRLKQPQQQRHEEEEEEESAPSSSKKPTPGLQREAIGSTNNALLLSGGVKGWRRGGSSTTGKGSISGGSNTSHNSSSNNRWLVELLGQRLRITPDKDATSLPLGEYRIGIEYGFVSDLVGNYNSGENNLRFTLAKDAGCPYLYVTGFTTENGNCNGLYLPTDPMNEQASWQGGERNAFFIYWKREPRDGGRPAAQDGNWIIDTNLEDSSFLAFADLHAHASKKQGRSRALPPAGLWHKWTGTTRMPQEHVQIHCTQQPDRFAASLIAIDPPVGAALQLSATTLLPLHPITLIFNKPMNYGHWAAIRLTPRGSSVGHKGQQDSNSGSDDLAPRSSSGEEVMWYADVEAGMRGNAIRVYNKPASEVLASFSSPPPSSDGSSDAFLEQREETHAPPPPDVPSSSVSPSGDKKINKEKRGGLTRALQKRLFEQKHHVYGPLRASDADASNKHLTLFGDTAQPETQSSAAGAASRAAAEVDTEDVVGVVELHVQQPLLPGETYDFTVQLGALTDLSYNPWGPVENGIIAFHTTGGRCRTALSEENVVIRQAHGTSKDSSRSRGATRRRRERTAGEGQQPTLNYAEAYVVLDLAGNPVDFNEGGVQHHVTDGPSSGSNEGSPDRSRRPQASDLGAFANGEAQDGTKIRVRCRPGYSVHASARGLLKAEETTLRCSDGRWHGEQQLPKCFRNCGVYPVLGGAYQMAGDVGGDGVEGEVIDVQCTNTAELLSPTGRQAIRCSGGKWDALLVKCGATCPPLGPTLGSKYEVKQVELRREHSGSNTGSHRGQGGRYSDEATGGGARKGGGSSTRDPATVLVPETGEAKEGAVRRISCAPGSHSVSSSSRRSDSKTRAGAGETPAGEEEPTEEIRCGKDGWEQLHLQCFADCPVEQLTALLGQHGPGLEAATEDFRDGRHGDRRDISCAVGFAPAAAKFSRLYTTCNDGRWLPLSISPPLEATAGSLEYSAEEKGATAAAGHLVAEGISHPVCVPRCATLQLPGDAYVVTSLPDVRGVDGSTQQQVRVRCAAAAVAVGGPGAATEQLLTCSRAGVWGLLTLQCKAPCRAPLLQLGDRYVMLEGSSSSGTVDRGGGATQLANSDAEGSGEAANGEAQLYPHGTERLVGCAPGAAVEGGGFSAAPQSIVCDDGLWQSAYRIVRTSERSKQRDSSIGSRPGSRNGAAAVDLKCRRGCGAPLLAQGVQPLLLSSRAVLLQRWQHGAQLLVGCTAGFSASHPDALGAPATVDSGVGQQGPPADSRQEELLICRDGEWESLTHPLHPQQQQDGVLPFFTGSSGSEERISRQYFTTGSSQSHQLQHPQRAAAEPKAAEAAASGTTSARRSTLYLALECRRDCAAADLRRLAQQQHFEFQQVAPYPRTATPGGASDDASSVAQGLSFGASPVPQGSFGALRHGQFLRVACQKRFESLSGLSREITASAISCSHGRLLLPRIVCGRPSCSDGIQNGDETGVDCGGSICSPCTSCSDGIQNNDETGVDCGGSCPPCHSCPFPPLGVAAAPPPVGMHHVIAVRVPQQKTAPGKENKRDASSGFSSSGEEDDSDNLSSGSSENSARVGPLFDEYRTFEETGRYVRTHFGQGGADRPLLPPGSSLHLQCGAEATASGSAAARRFAVLRCMPSGQWLWAADAAAAAASSPETAASVGAAQEPLQPQLICTPPTCFDGVRNGDETGVDCGGPCSRSCASCFNGIQDGEEEDIDCGGRDCEPCSSCSPRLLKPFLLNSGSTFAIVRRGAVVGTSAAAAAGISSSNLPSALLLDQELTKGILHPLLTGHGQQLQIKCRAVESPSRSYIPGRGVQASNEEASSSLAAASAGAYYNHQQQPQGVKQPLPLTVHCRHGVWTTPAVAAASALALTKNAGAPGQQISHSSASGGAASQAQQQDSWMARAALEAHQALENFREACTAYRRSASELNGFPGSYMTETDDSDAPGPAVGAGGPAAMYGSLFASRALPNASKFPAAARRTLFWSQPQFAVFAVPDFRVKPGSALAAGGGNYDRKIVGGELDSAESDGCVSRLIETFRTSLRGECGALAFGSSSLKISSFCSNSCRQGLEAAILAVTQSTIPASPLSGSSSSVDACSRPEVAARVRTIAQLLQELLDVWCKQRNGSYCFAEAEASFAFVQQLYLLIQSGTYYESELAAACPADSCFRNNIKHIVLLTRLSTLIDVPQRPAGTNSNNNGTVTNVLNPTKSARHSPQGSGSPSRRLRQQEQQSTDEPFLPWAQLLEKRHLQQHSQPQHDSKQQQLTREQEAPQSQHDRQNVHTIRLTSSGSKNGYPSGTSSATAHEEAAAGDVGKLTSGHTASSFTGAFSSVEDAESVEDGGVPNLSTLAAAEHNREEGTGNAATSAAATASETTAAAMEPTETNGERRLLAIPGTAAQGTETGWDESGTRRFLSDLTNLPQIMDLLCLRVEGQSCAPEVLRVGVENPVLQSPAADAEETQRICVRDPCVLEVVRTFGQLLMDAADASFSALLHQQQRNNASSNRGESGKPAAERRKNSSYPLQQPRLFSSTALLPDEAEGPSTKPVGWKAAVPASSAGGMGGRKREVSALQHQEALISHLSASSVQPRDVVLGMLMKYWGRTFCHRNVRGALCGGFVFPSKDNAALLQESRAPYPSWSPQQERRLYKCRCPAAFVGDGDCDISCFSSECEWDGGDCLATQLVFPVYRHLISQVGKELSEVCNPFNASFTCSTVNGNSSKTTTPKEAAVPHRSTFNKNCAAHFSKLAETRGCCLATQLEVLRDLLEADLRILAATRRGSSANSERDSGAAAGFSASSEPHGDAQHTHAAAQAEPAKTQPAWSLAPRRWRGDVWLQLDRSSFFFEYACQQQLDRTCSRGLSRFAYAVEFKIGNVDYDELLEPPASAGWSLTASGDLQSSHALTATRGLGHASIRRQKLSAVERVVPHPSSSTRRSLSQDSSSSVSHRQEARRGTGSTREGRRSNSSNGTTDDGGSRSSSSRSRRSAGEVRDENLQGKGALKMEESARELLLWAEASPKLHEFKRVLREELAAIFSVPAADVIEMRVWRGSIDVHAVIDAGWLSNRRSFKEHVESLTADPHSSSSLSARLSAGLTRHLSAIPSYSSLVNTWKSDGRESCLPLLVLGLPTFPFGANGGESSGAAFLVARGEGDEPEISVTPEHVFVERVPLVQQLRYHPGPPAAAAAMVAPPFGTFGVSELPTESRECIGAEGLHPAEGSSVSEAYRFFYKNMHSASAGPAEASQHGNTMVCALGLYFMQSMFCGALAQVECNVGHEAIAGENPQELVCNQGRWEPLSSLLYANLRLQPTSPAIVHVEREQFSPLATPASSSSTSCAGGKDYLSATDNSCTSKGETLTSGSRVDLYAPTKASSSVSAAAAATSSTLAAPATTYADRVGSSPVTAGSLLTQSLQQHAVGAAPRILVCRRPCLPYEKVDPAILRAEFVISGMGSSHGDRRSVFCAPGYSPREAEAFPSAQQMLTCVNGVWMPPRTLVCEKDFAAVSGSSSSSPCSGALSGLEERYRLTEVPLSSTTNPDISVDLNNAINARLQPKGVSLQVFRITCARGYTHQHAGNAAVAPPNALHLQQQQAQQQPHQNTPGESGRDSGEVYLACLNGVLIGFGTDELFPHGGSAEGHRAGKLAAAFEMRLRQHSDNTVTLARRRRAASALGIQSASAASARVNVGESGRRRSVETSLAAKTEGTQGRTRYEITEWETAAAENRRLQANVSNKHYMPEEDIGDGNDTITPDRLQEVEGEEDSGEETDYVQRHLTCETDVRTDPPIEAKPISDTVMVFLCLLVLFALMVFFLTGWWIWNTKKKRRATAAAEALTESSGAAPPAAAEKEADWPITQSGADGWNAENSGHYSDYYVQTTAPGLSQTGGSSSYGSGSIMQKRTSAHDMPAESLCENLSDVSGSDSQRLLLSRYYWLAAAAAAAGTATVEAAGRMEELDENPLAVNQSKVPVTNRVNCPAVNADEEPADALGSVLLVGKGSKCRERTDVDSRVFDEDQQGELASSSGSSPNCGPSTVTAALSNTLEINRDAGSPRQKAMLQLLLRHANARRLREQQPQAEQQQIKPRVIGGHQGVDVCECLGTRCKGHQAFPLELAQSENGKTACFTKEQNDSLTIIRRNSSKDYLSPVYLRGLPGDHGSVSEIKEQSVLESTVDAETARSTSAAATTAGASGWPPQTDVNVQPVQPRENASSVSLVSFQQRQQLVLKPPYQQQQAPPASDCGTRVAPIHPHSVLAVEVVGTTEKTAGVPGQLHSDGDDQLPVVAAQHHSEQTLPSECVLQQRKHLVTNSTEPGTTGSSQLHMTNCRGGDAAEPTRSTPGVQEKYCSLQNYALPASSSGARIHHSPSGDTHPSTSFPDASTKAQLTAHLGAFRAENQQSSISASAFLELMQVQPSRRHSAISNCSAGSRKCGVIRTSCAVRDGGGELRDEDSSSGGRGETATAVALKTAAAAEYIDQCVRSSTRLLNEAEDIKHSCNNTTNLRPVRRVQQEHKELPTKCASELTVVAPASEDELYPEDSASCVGQKGYRSRRSRNPENPSGCGGVAPATGSDYSSMQQLPSQLPTLGIYPFSEAQHQGKQRLGKQLKHPRTRRQRMQQQKCV